MTSTAELRNGICIVTLSGEFDRGNADILKGDIETCLEQASSVVFDFGAVTFANGAMMSLLHDVLDGLNDGGWLAIARPLPEIERIFRVAGLTSQPGFRIFPTLGEALEVIGRA